LEATLAARTYGELEAVVADLPGTAPAQRRTLIPASPVARVAIALVVAVPVIMAAIFLVTAVLSVWIVWLIVGYYMFGHHGRYRHARRGYGPSRDYRQAGAGPGRGFWA
jgi:uncharacterized membrane protein YdbT with pleckstrin-like domain